MKVKMKAEVTLVIETDLDEETTDIQTQMMKAHGQAESLVLEMTASQEPGAYGLVEVSGVRVAEGAPL